MSPLEILRQSFRPVGVPFENGFRSGIYLLLLRGKPVYCGSSRTGVIGRVGNHRFDFDEALWLALHHSEVFDYEGAITRFFQPRKNDSAPCYRGRDNEILEGLGLPPIANPEARARKWHLKRYAKMMRPWPEERRQNAARIARGRKESIQ